MSRIFAYARVSAIEPEPLNQLSDIKAAGFDVEPDCMISETVCGSVAVAQRFGFSCLFDRMRRGDVLVVTKLDRLGCSTVDIITTVARLKQEGIQVYCLALGSVDLTSTAGKLTMSIVNALAQFERELLVERSQSGVTQVKAAGKGSVLGRPLPLLHGQQKAIRQRLASGEAVSVIAHDMKTSRQTIMLLDMFRPSSMISKSDTPYSAANLFRK